MQNISVYIHIPWCVRKCPYCDFNSHTLIDSSTTRFRDNEHNYVDALIDDIEHFCKAQDPYQLSTIFFGGGTPSLFSGKSIDKILVTLSRYFSFSNNIEITLESNPGTFDAENYQDYFLSGVNRLSIGAQSFNNKHLEKLGRIHSSREITLAIEAAQKIGFNNINIDIMHGLPQQTIDEALSDLDNAIALGPSHISWYQLTIEPNTMFGYKPPVLPNEEVSSEIASHGHQRLMDNHFEKYEVSAYAKKSQHCQHNLNYWRFGDYLGFGAGAHGKQTIASSALVKRQQRLRHPKDYINSAGSDRVFNEELISNPKQIIFEFLLNNLRLTENVPIVLFEQRTGLTKEALLHAARPAIEKELLVKCNNELQLTELGHRFLNDVLITFLSK